MIRTRKRFLSTIPSNIEELRQKHGVMTHLWLLAQMRLSGSGHKLERYGDKSMPMKLRDGRKIWITFQCVRSRDPS